MNSAVVATQAPARVSGLTLSKVETIPWYLWACLTASLSIVSGVFWDISWHETIGRDTFWTPAHLLIQFAAVLAGLYSSYLIFSTTFGRDTEAKESSVRVLGFRGPLGAFICAWGGGAMLLSAPFDDWWHSAYGLDVKIISPPHALLAMGIAGIMWGSVILILGHMNRAEGPLRKHLEWMLLLTAGTIVIQDMVFKLEYSFRSRMHTATFYLAIAIGLPLLLEGIARATDRRWARTIMTGIYSVFTALMLWILPLFPAEPKLGPVYRQITHMVPLAFPVLIMAPAFLLDLLGPRLKSWTREQQALLGGIVFVVVLMAVQWPFADFLMYSQASRNWIFGTHYFPYFYSPDQVLERSRFVQWESMRQFTFGMGLALVAAILSTWLGIIWGNWMRRVRR